jgi:hypothetical protein
MAFLDLNRGRLVVIFAGYQDRMAAFVQANEGLQRRLDSRFLLQPYGPMDLWDILDNLLRNAWIQKETINPQQPKAEEKREEKKEEEEKLPGGGKEGGAAVVTKTKNKTKLVPWGNKESISKYLDPEAQLLLQGLLRVFINSWVEQAGDMDNLHQRMITSFKQHPMTSLELRGSLTAAGSTIPQKIAAAEYGGQATDLPAHLNDESMVAQYFNFATNELNNGKIPCFYTSWARQPKKVVA